MTARRVGVLLGGWGGDEKDGAEKAGEAIAVALEKRGHQVTRLVDGPGLEEALRTAELDVAFFAHHGRLGEADRVEQLLAARGIPFTGAGVVTSALARDRGAARRLFRHHNLATPAGYVLAQGELPRLEARHGDLGFPCVVKPACGGSALGPALVRDVTALRPAVEQALRVGDEVLVERYVKGREVTVAILDGEVLGCGEVSHGRQALDARGLRLHQPPRLSPTRVANLEAMALTAWRALGCRGVALVDFLCPEVGNEVLVQLDPQPDLSASARLPRLARASGLTFDELCERLLDAAALGDAQPAPRLPVTHAVIDARHAS